MSFSPTRTKICGITNRRDALLAITAGADALGFVFYPDSKRYISLDQAAVIAKAMPPMVSLVGVFANADEHLIAEALEQLPLSLLQFHGDETEGFCNQWSRPYIKAVRVKDVESVLAVRDEHQSAVGLLLDSHVSHVIGGSGETFDWSILPEVKKPVILSGGLNPDNVSGAIASVRPYAVDVSTGVESSPGIKDPELLQAFMDKVRK